MTAYAIRRFLMMIPVLVGASLVTFLAGLLAPGDPIELFLQDVGDPSMVARIRQEYGLDKPWWEQYLRYFWRLLHGDLGVSYSQMGRPVSDILGSAIPVTAQIAAVALLIAMTVGVSAGIISAMKKGSAVDRLARLVSLAGVSIPDFVLASILILTFALGLHLLPVAGWGEPANLILPAIVLSARPMAYVARISRSSMLAVLQEDYIRTAHAKGLSERRVLFRHALKNASIAIVTVMGIATGFLFTGSFVVESIFNVPGVGRVAIGAVFQRDYPVIQGAVMLFTAVFMMTNFLVDLAYGFLNPRIRYE